jgi:hypothetical protein
MTLPLIVSRDISRQLNTWIHYLSFPALWGFGYFRSVLKRPSWSTDRIVSGDGKAEFIVKKYLDLTLSRVREKLSWTSRKLKAILDDLKKLLRGFLSLQKLGIGVCSHLLTLISDIWPGLISKQSDVTFIPSGLLTLPRAFKSRLRPIRLQFFPFGCFFLTDSLHVSWSRSSYILFSFQVGLPSVPRHQLLSVLMFSLGSGSICDVCLDRFDENLKAPCSISWYVLVCTHGVQLSDVPPADTYFAQIAFIISRVKLALYVAFLSTLDLSSSCISIFLATPLLKAKRIHPLLNKKLVLFMKESLRSLTLVPLKQIYVRWYQNAKLFFRTIPGIWSVLVLSCYAFVTQISSVSGPAR